MPKGRTKPVVTKFKIGDKVRVKHGVRDTDYPDMPLGGWAGTIHEIHKDGMYTVRWSRETLAAVHPVFKKRCERDGMVLEEYWLGDDDLEPDDGGPLNIEHPTEVATKPLSPKDQDDRVRMVFGLTSNDPLPEVTDETLAAYHKYLSKNLAYPFEAERTSETGPFSSRTIQVKMIFSEFRTHGPPVRRRLSSGRVASREQHLQLVCRQLLSGHAGIHAGRPDFASIGVPSPLDEPP